jgi:sortase A
MRVRFRISAVKVLERLLLVSGVALLGLVAVAFVAGHVSSQKAVSAFRPRVGGNEVKADSETTLQQFPVDYALWSEKRIHEYKASLVQKSDAPLALLEIEKLRLEVPVFDGTDDLTLNRGVGRIIGTAHPGDSGNIGIAGHRDGFFRGLKDISLGDSLKLETELGMQTYRVDKISIVSPTDVSVLKNDGHPSVTLVTCYPFYVLGDAPLRYVLHASLASGPDENKMVKASLKAADSKTKENKK